MYRVKGQGIYEGINVWQKGEVVGEDDGKLIIRSYTPFNVDGFVEFEVEKDNVIIL